jgi:hypothetical protein
MAKYKGKSVRLNKPSRITKGQPGYGRAGQWSARKAQMLARAYKKAGGGYK